MIPITRYDTFSTNDEIKKWSVVYCNPNYYTRCIDSIIIAHTTPLEIIQAGDTYDAVDDSDAIIYFEFILSNGRSIKLYFDKVYVNKYE